MKIHCPSRRGRRGTTLIEVVAGLVVLSTLLVSVAIARGRFVRQWADAERRLRLSHEADVLLTRWASGPPSAVPVNGHGLLEGGVRWRTATRPDPAAATLGAVVVRLDVVDDQVGPAGTFSLEFLSRFTPPHTEVDREP